MVKTYQCLPGERWGRVWCKMEGLQKGTGKHSGKIGVFIILMVVMDLQAHKMIKIYKITHLKYVQFIYHMSISPQ